MSYRAWCSDFYVNLKLGLKMDLPAAREPVLELFDRIRRQVPSLSRLRRTDTEVALESAEGEPSLMWVAMKATSLRAGYVNPPDMAETYRLHRFLLETAPYFLSISPLDIDSVDLVFGFDLETEHDRDIIVYNALFSDSRLSGLFDPDHDLPIDVQPFIGLNLTPEGEWQAFVEVKTRPKASDGTSARHLPEPISVILTVRKVGPVATLDELPATLASLAGHAERLAEARVIPHVITPLRDEILSH